MKRIKTPKLRFLISLLSGALVWTLCIGVSVRAASAAVVSPPISQDGNNPTPEVTASANQEDTTDITETKGCAECHPDIQVAWDSSPHALAFTDPVFVERWKSLNQPGDCLVCHTTGYSANTDQFTSEGVTCEACHGPAVDGHPPAVIPVRADTEYCGACHTTTLGEWRLTGHSTADVGCTDCHNPHNQAPLFENSDEMCINCHKDDLGEHKNDVHIQKGIGCVECHALVVPPETTPPDGLIPTGHSFTITPATCVSCHTDTLRIGSPLPGYEDGAKAVSASLPMTSTVSTVVAEYTEEKIIPGTQTHEQTIQALEAALASARLSTLLQGGIIGLVLGGSTAYFIARNPRKESKENEQSGDNGDGDNRSGEGSEDA